MFGLGKLEKDMRFSCSVLWDYQMQFFENQGVNAWNGQVPFFITSNPNIGFSYAKVIFAYIKDSITQGKYDNTKPFYILELGTGTGKFSFYCIKKLSELLEFEYPGQVKICYIMSDFTMSNVDFWRQHPQLKPFAEKGILDFACLDMTNIKSLELLESKRNLVTEDFTNGLSIVGNYIFDTVPHDAFAVKDGKLFESRCSVETPSSNLVGKKPKDLEKLKVNFRKVPFKKHYSEYNTALRQVVSEYTESLKDTTFLIPISGIKTLDFLAGLTGDRILLISTDKGASSLTELEGKGDPSVVFHGSFSMMVNFHAMARYNELCNGDSILQPCHSGIKTIVLTRGFELSKAKYLRKEVENVICDNSPSQFFHLHRHLRQNPIDYGVETMISYLIFSHWDPYVFSLIHNNLMKKIHEMPACHLEILDKGMKKIEQNIFSMPNREDYWILIATYFQLRENFKLALEYADKSIENKGETYSNLTTAGFAFIGVNKPKEAIDCLQKAKMLSNSPNELEKLIAKAQKAL